MILEKIETKIETSSKESCDVIKEETTKKYSVKGDIIHDPKELEEIKKELEEKNSGDKKKKPLIERKGDWQCKYINVE